VPLVFLLAAPLLLIGHEITAPSWVRERVEAAAAEALGGGTLRFGAITVQVPRDLHPQVRLIDVALTDREGRVLARVPEATAQVSPRGLLFERQLLVQAIALFGAELSLSRAADGRVELAFGRRTPGRRFRPAARRALPRSPTSSSGSSSGRLCRRFGRSGWKGWWSTTTTRARAGAGRSTGARWRWTCPTASRA
jgi:uncharacterized protein involved in outer membrane biogenesis